MHDVVVGHGQDGELRDGPVPPHQPAGPFVDGRQIRVHVPGVAPPPASSTRAFSFRTPGTQPSSA